MCGFSSKHKFVRCANRQTHTPHRLAHSTLALRVWHQPVLVDVNYINSRTNALTKRLGT